ncbi:MAG: SPOR domain-containing protein [Rhodobiaceae bacterium]|nr:SPOR domain-containing protein [Rhodobiaceae bacterium]MCC0052506.1 SPOR domain-containing protein [Rhodobiaceae bacterium]
MYERRDFRRFSSIVKLDRITRACRAGIMAAALAGLASAAQAAPRYVSIAVDGATGEVVQSTSPDARVHPASLTKIMTLYILFEELEAGRVGLGSSLKVSGHAAAQAPSKLGLKPGSTIRVEDAILALVTKSANDIAVTIAENIAGSEGKFARRMTETAQRIGMSRTVFRNASGLPNSEQVTTARDMATLGRMIQVRFPSYYKYFSTTSFTFRGRAYRNHNRLVGRVEGVDGIKTGYIRASGFNLVSSIRRDDRHVVAVIIGARSGKARNAAMERLLIDSLKRVKPHRARQVIARGTVPLPPRKPQVPAAFAAARAAERAAPQTSVQLASAPIRIPAAAPATARADSGPLLLVPNGRGGFKVASASMAAPQPQPVAYQPAPQQQVVSTPLPAAPIPQAEAPQTTAAVPRITIIKPARTIPAPTYAAIQPATGQPATAQVAALQTAPQPVPLPAPAPAQTSAMRVASASGTYAIQIGAVPNEQAARKLIALAQLRAGELLAGRDAFTQTVDKDGSTLWRARFAGFDRDSAKDACAVLEAKNFGCFPVRN